MPMNELTLPWPPRVLNPNNRAHWSAKAKAAKAYKTACCALAKEAGWGPGLEEMREIHMWITFYPPDKRHYDDDNCAAAFKSGRDGLALALEVNDKLFRTHPMLHTDIGGMVKVRISGGP